MISISDTPSGDSLKFGRTKRGNLLRTGKAAPTIGWTDVVTEVIGYMDGVSMK